MKPYFILFLIIITCSAVYGQSTVMAANGEASGNGGTASFTLGEVFNQSQSSASGSLRQGVLQTYQISELTGIANPSIGLSLSAFPNPATDFLRLNIRELVADGLSFRLTTSLGITLQQQDLAQAETLINLTDYASGMYVLSVLNDKNQVLKAFKIIINK